MKAGQRVQLFRKFQIGRRPGLVHFVTGFAASLPSHSVGIGVAICAARSFDGTENLERSARGPRRARRRMTLAAGNMGVGAFERKEFVVMEKWRRLPAVLVVTGNAIRHASTGMGIRVAGDAVLGKSQVGFRPREFWKLGK